MQTTRIVSTRHHSGTDLATKGTLESVTIPLASFIPSFMGSQLNASERADLNPASLTKIGFMLSSRLSDGSKNPPKTYGEGTFDFSLTVESVKTVGGGADKKYCENGWTGKKLHEDYVHESTVHTYYMNYMLSYRYGSF